MLRLLCYLDLIENIGPVGWIVIIVVATFVSWISVCYFGDSTHHALERKTSPDKKLFDPWEDTCPFFH